MPIIQIVLTIIACGVLLWLAETFIPMNATIKQILRGFVILVLVLFLCSIFGLLDYVSNVTVQSVR